jgi:hypothetical protein
MLLGGLIWFVPAPTRLRDWQCGLLGWLGIIAILTAAICFDTNTLFPASSALVPCLGTALIIYANSTTTTWLGKVLSASPVVFVGLISYSLYLWHWPILAFSRYWIGTTLNWPVATGALAASFVAAYLSWRFVETPFRHGSKSAPRLLPYFAAAISMIVMLSASAAIVATQGFDFRLPQEMKEFKVDASVPQEFKTTIANASRGAFPRIGKQDKDCIDLLIWGDSHAMAIGRLSDRLAHKYELKGVVAAKVATLPVIDVWRQSKHKQTVAWNDAVMSFIRTKRIPNVILVSRWAVNVEGTPDGNTKTLITGPASRGFSKSESQQALRVGLLQTVGRLRQLGASVWVLGQVPLQTDDPRKEVFRAVYFGRMIPKGVGIEQHTGRQENVTAVFDSIKDFVTWLEPAATCFNQEGASRIGDRHGAYYADSDHLSPYGAEVLLAPVLEPVFAEMRISRPCE